MRRALALVLSLSIGTAPMAYLHAEGPDAKEVAKEHFERGVALFDEEAWDAALVEFLQSRSIYPTKNATRNAAVCLRMLHRYDEALDMFETLLRDFPELAPDAKAFAEKEIAALQALVGRVELHGGEAGATVLVDGRTRGTLPNAGVRVSAGIHIVRVTKDGLQPFEAEITVTGGQTTTVDVKLLPLVQSGKLRVVEASGKPANVRVDGVVVGKAPWEGTLPIGDHTVFLEGEGNLGTQPAKAPVTLGQSTPVTFALEELEAKVRIEPTPAIASVAIDGVVVGRGPWDGKLRVGAHKIEIASEGYFPGSKDITLGKGERLVVPIELEHDPAASLTYQEAQAARKAWLARRGSTFSFELRGHGNLLVLPHTDETSGYHVEGTFPGIPGGPYVSDNIGPHDVFGGGGLGGAGLRVAFLYLALADPTTGNNWSGFRVGSGVDVNFGYWFWKGQVIETYASGKPENNETTTHVESGAWGTGFVVNVPLTFGYQFGLGSYRGNDWNGYAFGVAWTPTWTLYKHSKFPSYSETNLAGFELSFDFLEKPMESKRSLVSHPRIFLYMLPPHSGKPILATIGGGAVFY